MHKRSLDSTEKFSTTLVCKQILFYPTQDAPLDIGLVTRLQNRVKELEREKKLMARELDLKEDLKGLSEHGGGSLIDTEREIYDTIKVGRQNICSGSLELSYSIKIIMDTSLRVLEGGMIVLSSVYISCVVCRNKTWMIIFIDG